ncbi:MAG: GNAT family N-acetyltransferase [Vicinamibacterales bacterium]
MDHRWSDGREPPRHAPLVRCGRPLERSFPATGNQQPVCYPDAVEITYSGGFEAEEFVALANRVWPRDYDVGRIADALTRTANIGARDGERLVGSVRVMTDGFLFATVPELFVDPDYQRQGIGRALMQLAASKAPRGVLFLGAQPESVGFFERIGCTPGPVGFVMRTAVT